LNQQQLTNKFKTVMDDLKLTEIDYIIEIDIVQDAETVYGDKFTTGYAGKGTVGLIIPDHLTPETENGEKIDVFMNPLSIFGRNNWGVIVETLFGKIITDIENHIRENDKQGVIERIEFIYKNYLEKEFKELNIDEVKQEALEILNSQWDKWRDSTLANGLFFYAKAFSEFSYKDIIEQIVLPYQEKFKINLIKKEKIKISKDLVKWLQDIGLVSGAIEADEDIWIEVFTGWNQILKLYHTAESKYNASNFAGKYTITGQPVRGRKNQGGSHVSWQTLGALYAAGATDIIKEIYTVKSDCLKDKIDFMTQMISEGEYYLKDKYESRTKDTVNAYLKLFGLKFN
jgi:DNA-directed RNA polymerase beta subunit